MHSDKMHYFFMTFSLFTLASSQAIYDIQLVNESALNVIPGCPSFLEDAYDMDATTLPACFCDRYFDPEISDRNLIQVKCLNITDLDGVRSAVSAVNSAGEELAFLSIEGIELPEGLPANFFQELNATPSHLSLKHCSRKQEILKFSDDLFEGSDVDKVKVLSITDCPLKYVPGFVKSLSSLQKLYLKQARLSEIKSDDFDGLDSLKILDLQNNWLHEIPTDSLKHMQELRVLYAGYNFINDSVFEALEGLEQLAVLSLSRNMIQSVSRSSFSTLKNLNSLILSQNWISEIPKDTFSDLPKLFQLLLDFNAIESEGLTEGKFSPLNVTILNLANNFLTEVPDFSDGLWPNLNFLVLNNNDIRVIGKQSFQGLNHLQMLLLSLNSNLTIIEPGAFKGLKKLQTLDLSGSSLPEFRSNEYFDNDSSLIDLSLYNAGPVFQSLELNPDAFAALTNLQRLDLGANRLTTLPVGIFDPTKKLATVRLAYNKFDCSQPKNLAYLVDWLHKHVNNYRDAQEYRMGRYPACYNPDELRGLPLVALSH